MFRIWRDAIASICGQNKQNCFRAVYANPDSLFFCVSKLAALRTRKKPLSQARFLAAFSASAVCRACLDSLHVVGGIEADPPVHPALAPALLILVLQLLELVA